MALPPPRPLEPEKPPRLGAPPQSQPTRSSLPEPWKPGESAASQATGNQLSFAEFRKPLFYGGIGLGAFFLVVLAFVEGPRVVFALEGAPSVSAAKEQIRSSHPLPSFLSLEDLDVTLASKTSDRATYHFSGTAQTNTALFHEANITREKTLEHLQLKDRASDLEKRDAALPANLQVKENIFFSNLPPVLVQGTPAGQVINISGTVEARKGPTEWDWLSPKFDTPPGDLVSGSPADGPSMTDRDSAAKSQVAGDLDSFERQIRNAEQTLAQANSEAEAKQKASDEDAKVLDQACAMFAPQTSFTGAVVLNHAQSWQINLRVTANQFKGSLVQGVWTDVTHPEMQKEFSGSIQVEHHDDGGVGYRLNLSSNRKGNYIDLKGEPSFFNPPETFFTSLTPVDDKTVKSVGNDSWTFLLQKDAPGTPMVSPAAPARAPSPAPMAATPAPTGALKPSVPSISPPSATQQPVANSVPTGQPPATSPVQAQASAGSPAASAQSGPVPETPPAPAPEKPRLPMYTPGNFPEGRIYSFPELSALAGHSVSDSWLYGPVILKAKDGDTWTFHSYRIATGVSFDVFSGEGGTVVEVQYPNDARPSMRVGQVMNVPRNSPLQLLSVRKTSSGSLVVRARNRQQF